MNKLKILVLTDHINHSKENSLYPLVQEMRKHPYCAGIDVATRGDELNTFFFKHLISKGLFISRVDDSFAFSPDGRSFKKQLRREFLRTYDVVWLRLPPPLSPEFLAFLVREFPNQLIINNPAGIHQTGSKAFLMNFPDLCPPMALCHSLTDIVKFKNQFPIVLKPLRDYGGRGIVKIDGHRVWQGKKERHFDDFAKELKQKSITYLGVKYLKNVSQGDKRIVVIDGRIMGASLRLPAKDSWLCNVSQGGQSILASVTEEERRIVERINPLLSKMGIVMYGVDTLVNDDGQRILSEINTTSIGGLPQMAKQMGQPLVKEGIHLLWNYIIENSYDQSTVIESN